MRLVGSDRITSHSAGVWSCGPLGHSSFAALTSRCHHFPHHRSSLLTKGQHGLARHRLRGRAINDQIAIEHPEDAHMGLWHSPRSLALLAFMQFLHWLILAHRIAMIAGASFVLPCCRRAPAAVLCICLSTRQQCRLPLRPSSVPSPPHPDR